jgi:hypothetical protein
MAKLLTVETGGGRHGLVAKKLLGTPSMASTGRGGKSTRVPLAGGPASDIGLNASGQGVGVTR